jgi:hypothetical protein
MCCICAALCAAHVSQAAISDKMDYGPFISYRVDLEPGHADGKSKREKKNPASTVEKGITVSLDADTTICFDTDMLRYAAGWTGGFLDMTKTNVGSKAGHDDAKPVGEICWTTDNVAGANSGGNDFVDPRPDKQGTLPRAIAHYRGLYKYGNRVVFSYTVGDVSVYDLPGVTKSEENVLFTRTLEIGKSIAPIRFLLAEVAGVTGKAMPAAGGSRQTIAISSGAAVTEALLLGATRDGAKLEAIGGKLVLIVPAHIDTMTVKVGIWSGSAAQITGIGALASAAAATESIDSMLKGGPPQWGDPIATGGRVAANSSPYVVDTITLPDENSWGSRMKLAGLDFFKDGRLAVCTFAGDVWIVSGIDATLQHVVWKRFATGLYEPLGLKIVDDQICVLGRDQITLLLDLNGDGEADFYENFNNDCVAADSYHAFNFDLQTDSKGDFYYAVDGNLCDPSVKLHGIIMKVSKSGDKSEVYARGFRAPNGTGIGPNDELVSSDNQGHWVPVDRINLVVKGGFYGYRGDPRLFKPGDAERMGFPEQYDPPICWIPYPTPDNSAGGEVWATSTKWGPLDGQMIQTSYGKSIILEVLWEVVDGIPQGGTVRLPMQFESGIMRARFSPIDGQLYVCGLKGWQTNARREGCLQRVRYTGKPGNYPIALHVRHDGIEISFSGKLDPATANDTQSYDVQEWNYRYSAAYGSPELKVSDPTRQGHDTVTLKSAKLEPDGRTVFLQIDKLQPVMQMAIACQLSSADGTETDCEIDNTINKVPAR